MHARRFACCLALTVFFCSAAAWAGIDYGPWLTGVASTGVAVRWGSPEDLGLLEWGVTEGLGNEVDSTYEDGIHHVQLSGLTPDVRYYYQVTSGGDVSDIHSFVTAPDADTPFRFAVISDTQHGVDVYRDIVEFLAPTEPAFVLHNGDMVDYPFLPSEWSAWWPVTDLLAGDAPYMPVRGNHDALPGGPSQFNLYWSNPMNEGTVSRSTYGFQYGNTYFIALDVNVAYHAGSEQYRWFEEQLQYAKSLPEVKHCIVHAHYSPFSCANHGTDANVIAFRRAMAPLFQEYDIDLYMSGHDHGYQRSVVNGLTYLVTGCSSGRLYDCDPQDWTVTCEKTANFSHIQIDGTQIAVEVRRDDNSVIESFVIDHDFHSSDDDSADDDDDDDDDNDDNDDADDDFVPPTDDDAADDDRGDDDDDDSGCGC